MDQQGGMQVGGTWECGGVELNEAAGKVKEWHRERYHLPAYCYHCYFYYYLCCGKQ